MKRFIDIVLFCILATIMGLLAATGVWLVLKVMNLGIEFLWVTLPDMIGLRESLIYFIGVCLVGGLFIGLWQKKFGLLPHTLEQVVEMIKKDGGYPYNSLHVIAVAALLPLIFGGALGPEAGLSGLIAGLCCLIGDRLKYKGDNLAALAETGFAATLGVIFGAPLFGIVGNLEPDNKKETYREKLVSKKTRIIIYCFGVLGGMIAFRFLNSLTGTTTGLPRFHPEHEMGIEHWKWFLPLLAIGIIFSVFYQAINRLTQMIHKRIESQTLISCMIAGLAVALCGYFLPLTMFSGEEELKYLIDEWTFNAAYMMLLSAMVKMLLVNICLNFGWRGGNIFPIIFCSALIGYSFAQITGVDGAFAVAVVTASLYGYYMRKSATVIAVLLLCFPVTYILPLGVSAIVASRIPSPFDRKGDDTR